MCIAFFYRLIESSDIVIRISSIKINNFTTQIVLKNQKLTINNITVVKLQ